MIQLNFDGKMEFEVTETDGTVNKIPIPKEVVKDMLNDWMCKFIDTALNRFGIKSSNHWEKWATLEEVAGQPITAASSKHKTKKKSPKKTKA